MRFPLTPYHCDWCPSLAAVSLAAQKPFALTIDNIMRGPGTGRLSSRQSPRWSGDSQKIYFEWKQASDELLKPMDTYVVNRDGSDFAEAHRMKRRGLLRPRGRRRIEGPSRTVYVRDGDIYLYDRHPVNTRQMTKTRRYRIESAFHTRWQADLVHAREQPVCTVARTTV